MDRLASERQGLSAVAAPARRVTISDIQHAVTDHYGIGPLALLSDRRCRRFSHPRQLAMWLAQQLTPHSLVSIGDRFRRDHTTVMHACRVVPVRLRSDPELRTDCHAVLSRIDLIRRSNILPFPVTTRRDSRPTINRAVVALAAEMQHDPFGTLTKLLRRTVDGPEIQIR